MGKTSDLNDVCVFCYKCVESVLPENSERFQNFNVFCKFLGRICGKKFNLSENGSCKLLVTCEDCVNIIDSFNELCHQVECLKLQMEWRLEKIKNVMKCADKIPSRVKQFQSRYSIPKEQQQNGTCVDGDECKQLLETRNVIQLSVSKYLSNVFPRVRVETVRKSRDCDLSIVTELDRTQLQNARVPFNVDPLLEWLTTVIAVTICCFPIVCYHQKAPPSTKLTLGKAPEIICESDTVSEPVGGFTETTSPELIEMKQGADEILSSSPPSPDNFQESLTEALVPGILRKYLEKDTERMRPVSDIMQLKPEFSDPLNQQIENTPEQHRYDKIANLQDPNNGENASEFKNDIPYMTRQLRSKFKCTICSLTFSTEHRLNQHSQSCTRDCETEDEEDEGTRKSNMTSYFSENDMPMEEDSDSDDSPEDLSDIEPNAENKAIKTVSEESAPTLNLTAAEIRNRMKDINEDKATIPCPEESCNRLFFTQGDLVTHSKQHGIFRCNFCSVEKTFAPDLALHELQHASSTSSSVAIYKCSRCAYIAKLKHRYLIHHLRKHLHISPDTFTIACPVCLQNIKSFVLSDVKNTLTAHFIRKHTSESPNDESVSGYEFMCQVTNCGKRFEHKCDLDIHTAWHSTNSSENGFGGQVMDSERVEGALSCDICSRKFVYLSELNLHKKIRHNPDGTQRGSVVISDDGLTIDDLLDESNAKWPCPVKTCKLKFFTEDDLASHAKFHGSFKCKFCPVVKKFAPELAYHEMKEHTRKKKSSIIKCSRCDYSGSGYEPCINHHVKVHLNLLPDTVTISCPNCQQTFKGLVYYKSKGSPRLQKKMKSSLVQHFYSHHDKSTLIDPTSLFNCEHCPAYFIVQHQLLVHTQRMHPEHTSLSCADCCQQFRDRRQVINHRTAVHHSNDESGYEFVCPVLNCSRRFEYECDLQRHTASHSKYSSNTCPECGKVIFNKFHFDRHVNSHQGHVCEQCGKKFRHKNKLTVHMLYHAGPDSWQFMCDICSVKCTTKGKQKEHKRIHSKTKPYICETCGATYAHRHNWRHHMIKKHGVADFTKKHTKTKNYTSRKGTKQQVPSKRVQL